jgi:hypothetical protein
MSSRKLSIEKTPSGSLDDRRNAYLDLAKKKRNDRIAEKRRNDRIAEKRGLTHGNNNDVFAPERRMISEEDFKENQNKLLLENQRQSEEENNMQMFEYKENEKKHAQAAKLAEEQEEEAKIDKMNDLVQKQISVQSKKRKQKSIEDVIEISTRYAGVDEIKWLLIDETESKYYKVGRFISKYDLGLESLGLYLPREDYKTFYRYSNFLVFYEFKNAVFSDRNLNGKFFTREDERDESSNNQQLTKIDTTKMKEDLDRKKEYVHDAKQYMRSKIMRYLGINFVHDLTHEPYIEFYEQIVPMVQRNLENNPSYNGNIDNAIAQLPSLEEKVKQVKQKEGTEFDGDEYAKGKYMSTIIQLLSPVVAAPVAAGPPPVIQTAASAPPPPASASAAATSAAAASAAAAPQAAASAWRTPTIFTNIASAASGAASDAANYLKGNVNYLGSSGANWARAKAGYHQDITGTGMVFAKKEAPPYIPPVTQLSSDDDTEVSNTFNALKVRRSEQSAYYGNTNIYHGEYDYRYLSDTELMDIAKKIVGEKKAAAAAKKPWFGFGFGGKRKSKRKQKRSQKQKKSRKQRR